MPATRPINERRSAPRGLKGAEEIKKLVRRVTRSSRPAPSVTGSGNGFSAPNAGGGARLNGSGF